MSFALVWSRRHKSTECDGNLQAQDLSAVGCWKRLLRCWLSRMITKLPFGMLFWRAIWFENFSALCQCLSEGFYSISQRGATFAASRNSWIRQNLENYKYRDSHKKCEFFKGIHLLLYGHPSSTPVRLTFLWNHEDINYFMDIFLWKKKIPTKKTENDFLKNLIGFFL